MSSIIKFIIIYSKSIQYSITKSELDLNYFFFINLFIVIKNLEF